MSVPIYELFPPELIADEYVRHNKDNRVLYIFYDAMHENYKDHYKKIFENETCKCANMFKITTKEEVKNQINIIISEQNHDEKDCFMLLFLGSLNDIDNPDVYNTDGNGSPIKGIDIWRPFANSHSFIYRPKIFIFHAFYEDKSYTELDAKVYMERKSSYNIPREADVLIVYKQTSNYGSYAFTYTTIGAGTNLDPTTLLLT